MARQAESGHSQGKARDVGCTHVEAEVLVLSRKGKLREQSLKMQFSSQVLFSPFLWLSSDDRMPFGGLTKG